MAEQKSDAKQASKQTQKAPAPKVVVKKPQEEMHESLIRIFGYDIPGSKNVLSGLIKIKGVSWTVSNAACAKLNISRTKKISELSREEITKIEKFLETFPLPDFMKNRRFDFETGETTHLFGSDLDIKKEFDIKRLKKIKSYKGLRHISRQPVRGQRTKSHFRANKKKSGGIKKNDKKA